MFQSQEIADLRKRIQELEQWKASHERDVVEQRNFTVYDQEELRAHQGYGFYHFGQIPQQQVGLKA